MTNMWTIKAIYPMGGHVVFDGDQPYRFSDKQSALDKVETMNAVEKKNDTNTRYIVVLDN